MPRKGTKLTAEAEANNARAIARWKKENVDNLSIGVRKGKREAYRELAQRRGTSLSELVQRFLDAECEREGIPLPVIEAKVKGENAMKKESVSVLYRLIKEQATEIPQLAQRFEGHQDRQQVLDLHIHMLEDLIRDYKAGGGKRSVDAFLAGIEQYR